MTPVSERPSRSTPLRVAVLGRGAIGRRVAEALRSHWPHVQTAIVVRHAPAAGGAADAPLPHLAGVQPLLDWRPRLVVECAGHEAIAQYGEAVLRAGADLMLVSIGALADAGRHDALRQAAQAGGARLILVDGAIGGLDALRSARIAGLSQVRYTGRKPAQAWRGTPAEALLDLDRLQAPVTFFEGAAREAAQRYPKNANVTAAVALAGVGFDDTHVHLVAEPHGTHNVHELHATGAFGELAVRIRNEPLPDNPKTSWLAALSIEAALQRELG